MNHSLPDYAALRQVRDFLGLLLDASPDGAVDILTNHGSEAMGMLMKALGSEAFVIGDAVLASPEEAHCKGFQGAVRGLRTDTDGTPLFTIEDGDGVCFDCIAEEVEIDVRNTGIDITSLFTERATPAAAPIPATKKILIPVTWEMAGTVAVDEASIEEAVAGFNPKAHRLPEDGEYVEGSFQLTTTDTEEMAFHQK